jgi:hypothetical protein
MNSKQISGVFNMTTMNRAYFKKKDTGKVVELLTETITPICCDGCGKLLRYSSTVNDKAYHGKDN